MLWGIFMHELTQALRHPERATLPILQAVIEPTITDRATSYCRWRDPLERCERLNLRYELLICHDSL